RHWRNKQLGEMTDRDWRILREDFGISYRGLIDGNSTSLKPLRFWQEAATISRHLVRSILEAGFEHPTPIQRAAIPIGLSLRDMIGLASTGSGKTLAYVIPIISYVLNQRTQTENGPYALILAPTRELALQIEKETQKLMQPLGLKCIGIVGGHSIEEQAMKLRSSSIDVIIATPGRMVDCLKQNLVILDKCGYIVLDEADEMINKGFEEPLTHVLSELPPLRPSSATSVDDNTLYRHTMMFSATMPPALERIAQNYLVKPVTVTVGAVGDPGDTVEQRIQFLSDTAAGHKSAKSSGADEEQARRKLLAQILLSKPPQFMPPIIVFINTKSNTEALADVMSSQYGIRSSLIATYHADKSQDQREAALNRIRDRSAHFLFATDVAGRGIDIKDVSLVINYHMPNNIERYTHRIGRTGRAGSRGVAISFVGTEDSNLLPDLLKVVRKSRASTVPSELLNH
ncbi:DEAD-domain-containing protein, partial [Ramicandelaber brevisporus]